MRTAHGEWWGRVTDSAWRPQPGEKVQLGVRPESLHFVERAEGRNNITGTISEAIYLGELAQYTVTDAAALTYQISELNPAALHQAAACVLAVAPEDVMILKV